MQLKYTKYTTINKNVTILRLICYLAKVMRVGKQYSKIEVEIFLNMMSSYDQKGLSLLHHHHHHPTPFYK